MNNEQRASWVSPDLSERSTQSLFVVCFEGELLTHDFLLMATVAAGLVRSSEASRSLGTNDRYGCI
jgi:hypothetical protein